MSLLLRRRFLRSRTSPAPSDGRYHGPPNPPRDDRPRWSPVMAVCLLAVGAQQSGLTSRNDMTSNTLHGKA
jgi:hypothetical protein